MKQTMFSLEGRVAIVTGCSDGIGQAMTIGLAKAGADIFGVYNSTSPKQTEEAVLTAGRAFCAVQADLSDRAFDAKAIVDACMARYGRVDILINNAGVCLRANALEYTDEMWENTLQVNLSAAYHLSQEAAGRFKEQGYGKIINLASMLSYHGGQNVCAYTATKHAIVGLTKSMASDLGKFGIRVNAIAPGWIKTKLSAAVRNDPQRSAGIVSRIPLGDWGDPASFKGAAVFLASAASDYITGVTLPVDGGYLVR